MYSPTLLDHFENPRNGGACEHATACARVENPVCGDVLELSARVEHGVILAAGFRAKGCVPAMACASALTELLKGRDVRDAARLGSEDVAAAVGGVPPGSLHAAQMAVDAVRALIRDLRSTSEATAVNA